MTGTFLNDNSESSTTFKYRNVCIEFISFIYLFIYLFIKPSDYGLTSQSLIVTFFETFLLYDYLPSYTLNAHRMTCMSSY